MLYIDDKITAQSYLDYAQVVDRTIIENKQYKKMQGMCTSGEIDKVYIAALEQTNYQHKRGYEPPKDYEEIIDVEESDSYGRS